MSRVHLSDIDLVTFLRYHGHPYKTIVEGDKVVFIFEDEDGRVSRLIEEYPTSEVNRILSIYHGLHKTVRSIIKNQRGDSANDREKSR